MPGFIARKLCPHLIFVKPNFNKYREASEQTHKVFERYDPHFISASLDEAYLDVTEYLERDPDLIPEELAARLRNEVERFPIFPYSPSSCSPFSLLTLN
jgi:DNA polymerase kappa